MKEGDGGSPIEPLGRALHARAPAIGAAAARRAERMIAQYPAAQQDVIRPDIERRCTTATQLVARFLGGGDGVTEEEWRRIASVGRVSAEDRLGLADLMKLYLNWRDATLAAIDEIAAELALEPPAVARARGVVHAGCDASIVRVAKAFEHRRRELEATLAEEQARLAYLARHDVLTGLPNRAALFDALRSCVERCRRDGSSALVLFIDLDDFKQVNDVAGHAAGDQLLVAVARRLAAVLRPTDVIARLGGDEFVVVCDDTTDATGLSERLREVLATPFRVDGASWTASASIGATVISGDDDPERILVAADTAMYAEKRAAKGGAGARDR